MPARPLLALLLLAAPAAAADPLVFRVTLDAAVARTPVAGRLFVLLLRGSADPVPKSLNWFDPEPGFARDITHWTPGDAMAVGPDAVSHPTPLAKLKPGKYTVQAVLDRNVGDSQSFAASDGNLYSLPKRLDLDPASSGTIELKLDQVFAAPAFRETKTIKLVDIPSRLLTKHHARPVRMRAAVLLPSGFDAAADRKFPVVYEVPGFGGNHTFAPLVALQRPTAALGTDTIHVLLDPDCRTGHHVFADSAVNGPVGRALVEELIPHVEAKYRGNGCRYVTGHSSGGWSSLWLQVTYPDTFAGCWSTSPDPVDFRDFQRTNLYQPGANLFREADGKDRPLARRGGKPVLFFQPFSDMEVLMGRGGQLASFEAVFSPPGPDGSPRKLWDRKTGAIDTAVAKTWEKYDIRLVLDRNWQALGPKLAGKVHVWMGEEDTFYLDGATRLLKAWADETKAGLAVELFPGRSHALVNDELRKRMHREMAAAYKQWQAAQKPDAVPGK